MFSIQPRNRPHRGGMYVSMIYPPNPKRPQLFAVYLLALVLRGVKGFKDLRTLNRPEDIDYDPARPRRVCQTFVEACVARGLLRNDETWRGVMTEASATIHNYRLLTRFFVSLLVFARLPVTEPLFTAFQDRMMRPSRPNLTIEDRLQDLLRRIERLLEEHNLTMADFGLPEPIPDPRSMSERVRAEIIPPVYNADTGEEEEMTAEERLNRAMEMRNRLNADQQGFVDLVFSRLGEIETELNRPRGNPFRRIPQNKLLLQGEAGTGKTTALDVLIELCHARGKTIKACAPTGIAASRLIGGVTLHSLAGIPVYEDHETRDDVPTSIIDRGSYRAEVGQEKLKN